MDKILTHNDVLRILPDRHPNAHKGNFGRILLLCGSRGFTGAAALAALGALRTGAGLVYLAVPESIYAIEAIKLLEPIVLPLADENGMFSWDSIPAIKKLLPSMDAILIGPGVGCSEAVSAILEFVLSEFRGPVVIDADGINVLGQHKDVVRGREHPVIITPHVGEFLRIGGSLESGRTEGAMALAKELKCIVVLKGNETIITDGEVAFKNTTGNPGMAVGGSGDVLAGMITSLLGQQLPILQATACAVWLHGAAGDICAEKLGQYCMLPSDILDALPRLMK